MKLKIEISPNSSGQFSFTSGQTITGFVIVSPNNSVKINRLILLCNAEERCDWHEGSGSNKRYYNITREFMDQSYYLIESEEPIEVTEETKYPFSINLPNTIPPSLSLFNPKIAIDYSLTARLIKKGLNSSEKHVLNVTAPLQVIDGYSSGLRTNEGFEQTKKCKSLGRLFGAKPPFEGYVNWKDTNVDHKDYCAPVSVECVNRMKSSLTCDVHFFWSVNVRAFRARRFRVPSQMNMQSGEVTTENPKRKMKNMIHRVWDIDFQESTLIFKSDQQSVEIPANSTKSVNFQFKPAGPTSVLASDYDKTSWEELYKQPFFKPISFKTVPNVHISLRKAKKTHRAIVGNLNFVCPMNLLSVPGAPCELFPGLQTSHGSITTNGRSNQKQPSGPFYSDIDPPPPSYSTTTSTSKYPQFS